MNESVRKMSREEEFNMEEFEKRILQIEVRILSKFDQKIINGSLDLICIGCRHHWLVQRGEGGGWLRMVLMMSMKRLMMSRWMRCSLAKVVEAMRSNDNWGFNNWRSCAGGHVYLVGRSFKLPYSPLAT